ncbi:MAG: phosphodiesterase [Gammaproteobacteria bacterium]
MDHRGSIHVVVVDSAKNRARHFATTLEKAGYDVLLDHVTNSKMLEDILAIALPDVVLYGSGAKIPTHASVSASLGKHDHEIPLLVVEDEAGNIVALVEQKIKSTQQERRLSLLENEVANIRLQQQINELETTLKEQEIRCQALVDNSRDAIAYIFGGKHIYGNQSYLELFDIESIEALAGMPVEHMVDPSDHKILDDLLRNQASSETITANIELALPVTHAADLGVQFSTVCFDNKLCTRITIGGVTINREIQDTGPGQELDMLDRRDVFTGLHNRQYFIQALDENIRNNQILGLFQSVTYVLLDNFKSIRENIGIIASDQLIGEIAELIKEVYGPEATIAQFGDYVFTILSYSSNTETCILMAQTLRQRLEEYKSVIQGQAVHTTGSIGICVINDQIKDTENAILRADLACEIARSSGGNQVHVHSTAIDDQIHNDIDHHWDEMIRKTVDENRFYLVYQPIVSMDTDKDARYEVLLRVVDEAGHVILPGQFISIAEQTGAIGEIDRRIISAAIRTLSGKKHRGASLFVKISGHTLADMEFPDWVQQELSNNQLHEDQIIFEITASAAVHDRSMTLAFVHAMHNIHCKVAIEHIGHTIQPDAIGDIPVDYLKIDGSLINNLLSSKKDQASVRNIVEFAQRINIPCIAERVDDASCLVMLWQYSMDYIQGNFVQEPRKSLDYDFDDEIASSGMTEVI